MLLNQKAGAIGTGSMSGFEVEANTLFAGGLTSPPRELQHEVMEHPLSHSNVGSFLSSVLEVRRAVDSSYSLRALSRDLGIAPSTLSEVMSGRKGLSKPMTEKLILALRLSPEESDFFRLLADPDVRRSEHRIEAAKRALQEVRNRKVLSLEVFQVVANWYHSAILEGLKKSQWRRDLHSLATLLSLPLETVASAVRRLKRLGLVSGDLQPRKEQNGILRDGPAQALKSHRRQLLKRATEAHENSDLRAEGFLFAHMTFDSCRWPEALQRLQTFQAEMVQEFGCNPEDSDQIRCLAVQFFPLAEESGSEKSAKRSLGK